MSTLEHNTNAVTLHFASSSPHRYEQLHGLNEENIANILTYYTHAKDTDETCYKAWHAYAYMNFEAILFYKGKMDAKGEPPTTPGEDAASGAAAVVTPSKKKVRERETNRDRPTNKVL